MADYLLHEGATVECLHFGQAKPTRTDSRVRVSGQKIVTWLYPHDIKFCKLPTEAGGPCLTATWIKAAMKVKASGKPVLLKDSQAVCTPTTKGVKILSTQTRVKGT